MPPKPFSIYQIDYNSFKKFKAGLKKVDSAGTDVYLGSGSMLTMACDAGNLKIVKYIMENYKIDPNVKSSHGYPLPVAMRGGRGNQDEGSFRDVIIYLIDEHHADPSIDNNATLKAAKQNGLNMFKGDRVHYTDNLREQHDSLIDYLLKDKRVISTAVKNDQTEWIPDTLKKIFLKKDKK